MTYPRYSVSGKGSVYLSNNADLRKIKAIKINSLITEHLSKGTESLRLLDIGTGYGGIATELSKTFASVFSIDIADERKIMKGYDFKLYDGMNIPFPSNFFDVVIANHVIEHVQDQAMTLSEVSRVLNDNGICYIAVPNKWSLIEPHFKFPFLSWFPQKFSDFIVQTFKKTNKFDVKSHGLKGYLSLMSDRFYVKNITYKFFKLPDSNIPFCIKWFKFLPDGILRFICIYSTTYIFILSKRNRGE